MHSFLLMKKGEKITNVCVAGRVTREKENAIIILLINDTLCTE